MSVNNKWGRPSIIFRKLLGLNVGGKSSWYDVLCDIVGYWVIIYFLWTIVFGEKTDQTKLKNDQLFMIISTIGKPT